MVNGNFVYVFGGMTDLVVLKSIEKYDVLADRWAALSITLPTPLAKMGTCLMEDDTVLIVGGVYPSLVSIIHTGKGKKY